MRAGDMIAAEDRSIARIIDQQPMLSPKAGTGAQRCVFTPVIYDGSLADIEQTLKLEPRHFGAFWGLGMILGFQQDYERAIGAFEKLLEIKPNSQDARPRIEALKQALAKVGRLTSLDLAQ